MIKKTSFSFLRFDFKAFSLLSAALVLLWFCRPNAAYADHNRFDIQTANDGLLYLKISLNPDEKLSWLGGSGSKLLPDIALNKNINVSAIKIFPAFPQIKQIKDGEVDYFYDSNTKIPLYLKPVDPLEPVKFSLIITYGICKTQCSKVTEELEYEIRGDYFGESALAFPSIKLEKVTYNINKQRFSVLCRAENLSSSDFIIEASESGFLLIEKVKKKEENLYLIKAKVAELDFNQSFKLMANGCMNLVEFNGEAIESEATISFHMIIFYIVIGFLGGVILNFMPCTLPVLSIKIFSILNNKENPDYTKNKLLSIIAGIFFSFSVIAALALIIIEAKGSFIWGSSFQNPYFLITMSIFLTFFISQAQDRISIYLPDNMIKVTNLTNNSYLASFITGVFSTSLSSSCVAPFLGAAFSFIVAAQNNLITFLIFEMMALGFAMPYILLIVYPRILKKLPSSGFWLVRLKQLLILSLVLTQLWIIYIYTSLKNIPAGIVLFLLLVLLKFTLENSYMRGYFIKVISLVTLILCCYILPSKSQDYDFGTEFNIQENSLWQEFKPMNISKYIEDNKVVIVDITADWCATCKVNELNVFKKSSVINMIKDEGIIAMRGDFTNYNKEIEEFLNKYNTYGIPFNIVFGPSAPQGIKLPVILSVSSLEEAIVKASAK